LWFDEDHRNRFLARVSRDLVHTQTRNQQAHLSHRKTRRRRLHALNLFTSAMRCCIPP
jgi:hypothetical protein